MGTAKSKNLGNGMAPTGEGWSGQKGYSLLEVTMAIFVTTVGMVSLLALFSQSVVTMFLVQEDLVAKQKAREIMESIYTARSTRDLTFDSIQNVPAPGVFLSGFQPLLQANPVSGVGDGLVGTADDGTVETLQDPGDDGQLGTGDDVTRALTNFERKIEITPVPLLGGGDYSDLRKLSVTVRYTSSQGWQRAFEVSSFFSRYR